MQQTAQAQQQAFRDTQAMQRTLMQGYLDASRRQQQAQWSIYDQQIEDNISRVFPAVQSAWDTTLGDVENLKSMQDQAFYGALESVIPNWRELFLDATQRNQGSAAAIQQQFNNAIAGQLQQTQDIAAQEQFDYLRNRMTGALDSDEYNAIRRQMAEAAQGAGIRGQAAQNLQAVGLARESMGAAETARGMLTQASVGYMGSYNQLMAAANMGAQQTGANYQNAMQWSAGEAQYNALFAQNMGTALNMGVNSAQGVLGGVMGSMGVASQASNAAMGAAAGIFGNAFGQAQAMNAARRAANQGGNAAMGIAGGAMSGAAAGAAFGPWGAAIGGVVGGTMGYFSSR